MVRYNEILSVFFSGGLHVIEVTPTDVSPCFSLSTSSCSTRGHSALVRCMDWKNKVSATHATLYIVYGWAIQMGRVCI